MPTFSGRIESRFTVPTGGASVSASNSGGGATTVTVPAGNYYLTSAGGVSGFVAALQTALNTSRAPSSGEWTVALGSDGRVSIGCTGTTAIPSFSVDWSNTTERDLLGFEYAINYPTDATELERQVGYGVWDSGTAWLCNETTGALAPVFGAVSLSVSSAPAYSTQGPRGGPDKAITMNEPDLLTGGDNFDVTGTDDLIVVWVGKVSSTSSFNHIVGKGTPGAAQHWSVYTQSNRVRLRLTNASTGVDIDALSFTTADEWYVGMAVVERATATARVGYKYLTSGTSAVSSNTASAGLDHSNANNLLVGKSSGFGAQGGTQDLAYLAVVTGVGVATGLSASLSTALSTFAGQFGTVTGTEQAEGVWYPDAPLTCDDHPSMAPRMSDLRTSQSPTGVVLGLSGNTYFKHTNVGYQRVPVDRIREASATYANASLEVFWEHTQLGLGPSWFSVSSPVQVYWSDAGVDTLLGEDETITGWTITGAGAVKDIARPSQRNWVGQFDVTLPALIASGA
jgi:hypothetical protein